MKINDAYLDGRVQKDLNISEPMYLDGLFDVVHVLMIELEKLLDAEGRRFGIMMSYLDSMFDAFDKITPDEADYEVYGKVFYLFKPIIVRDYRRLLKRGLSRADAMITIILRILEVIMENKGWQYYKNCKTVYKIITKVHDNIRGSGKKSSLNQLKGYIRKYMSLGMIGRYSLDGFSIFDEESKFEKKVLPEPDTVVAEENTGKVQEISWE